MPRQTLTMPFGGGLDRLSGVTAVDTSRSVDLRNVHLGPDRMELRRGLGSSLAVGFGTDVIAVVPVKKTGLAAVVVYDSSSRDVKLYSTDGASVSLVGTVFNINSAVAGHIPRVSVAEVYSKVFIAHDEPLFQYRNKTRVFDVTESTLSDFTLDLERSNGFPPVYFRGVAKHLAYLLAWGFGTQHDPDRPEVLRISMPGDPLTFVPEHYFLVGSPSDPIIMGRPRGEEFVAGKNAELWRLVGYDRTTFGIAPGDMRFGPATSRAHVEVNGELFFWSLQGPRSTTGGPSVDLSPPLDLPGPLPDAAAALNDNVFAWYDQTEGEVVFCFGTFAYALHLKADPRRWSYRAFGLELNSAGLLFSSTGTGKLNPISATIGTVVANTPSYASGDDNPTFTVPWTLSGAGAGTETVEVWAKHDDIIRAGQLFATDVWRKVGSAAATAGTLAVVVPYYLTTWNLAVRVVAGGTPGTGYTGSPESWPSGSRAALTSAGSIVSFALRGIWQRATASEHGQPLAFVGAGSSGAFHPEVQYFYEQATSADAFATWHPHAFAPQAPPTNRLFPDQGATSGASGIYDAPLAVSRHSNVDRLVHIKYRLTILGPDANAGPTSATAEAILGPEAPTITSIGADSGILTDLHLHPILVAAGAHGGSIEVKARHDSDGTWSVTYTVPDGIVEAVLPLDNTGGADNVRVEARTHVASQFSPSGPGSVQSIDDYSEVTVGTASF